MSKQFTKVTLPSGFSGVDFVQGNVCRFAPANDGQRPTRQTCRFALRNLFKCVLLPAPKLSGHLLRCPLFLWQILIKIHFFHKIDISRVVYIIHVYKSGRYKSALRAVEIDERY